MSTAPLLFFDAETRSLTDLPTYGLDRYVNDPSTEVLMASYAFDDGPVELWEPRLGPIPTQFKQALTDPSITKVAWNSEFERNVFKCCLGIWVPYDQWLDPMINARMLSMPGYLDSVGEVMGLPEDQAKKTEGQRLIKLFTMPQDSGGGNTLFGVEPAFFRDWKTDPADWELFREYCKGDTIAERAILKKMVKFPLPEVERRGFILDQQINDRGMPVDMEFVNGSALIAAREKERLQAELKQLTKLENPNSNEQMLEFVRKHGYPFNSLAKPLVTRALGGECKLDPEARKVLEVRKQAAKISDSKLLAIQNIVGADARLRYQLSYMGSARAGRWAGHDVQLQNFPRPVKSVEKNMEFVVEALRKADYDSLQTKFPGVIMDCVASAMRASFRAPEGKKFVVCDLNAIENRVLGWVARCDAITQVFVDDRCPYLSFATQMYREPYEALKTAYDAGDGNAKDKRQMAKPAVLGAGYRLGGGDRVINKDGDEIYTGLWGYAKNMGIEMPKEKAHEAVKIFRDSYPEVVQLWYDLETASFAAIESGEPQRIGPVTFQTFGTNKLLRIMLPSGRGLHYIHPKIEIVEQPQYYCVDCDKCYNVINIGDLRCPRCHGTQVDPTGNVNEREQLVYDGIGQISRQWERVPTHGGKLTENIVQAISRDLLLHGMMLADAKGFEITGHCHDEIISLVNRESFIGLPHLRDCMITSPDWAKDLPLNADGWEGVYYKKG